MRATKGQRARLAILVLLDLRILGAFSSGVVHTPARDLGEARAPRGRQIRRRLKLPLFAVLAPGPKPLDAKTRLENN